MIEHVTESAKGNSSHEYEFTTNDAENPHHTVLGNAMEHFGSGMYFVNPKFGSYE